MPELFSNITMSSINNLYYCKRDQVCKNIDREKILSMFSDKAIVNIEYKNSLSIRKRIRPSILDAHFHVIAEFMAKRLAQGVNKKHNDNINLSDLTRHLIFKTGINISKSALSRYLSKHPLLKEI